MRGIFWGLILSLALWVLIIRAVCGATVNLGWDMPTNNVDGTPLTDLAGAKVYQGIASSNYTVITDCPGAGTTNATLTLIGTPTVAAWAGTVLSQTSTKTQFVLTWPKYVSSIMPINYFNGTAYNAAGLESDFCSNEVAKGETPPVIVYEVHIGSQPVRTTTSTTLTVLRSSIPWARHATSVEATWGTNVVVFSGTTTLDNNKPWRLAAVR